MRHHHYANTTAQQQPRRETDRQQQQWSGSGDHQPRRAMPIGDGHAQQGGIDAEGRVLRLVPRQVQAG